MATKKVVKEIKERYNILVIGSGGTGTYFLKEFNHYIARDREAQLRIESLVIADGDTVEEKNLDRQCFYDEDIGRNKAGAFADILNDAMENYNVSSAFRVRWKACCEYVTETGQIEKLLCLKKSQKTFNNGVLFLHIPVIIGCVDNNACRLLCEEVFKKLDYCFYYDSGNDFSTGEVVYAHRFAGKTISYEKSFSYPSMFSGDLRPVTELSCAELNQSDPQHFLTNMTAAQHILRGMVALFTDTKEKDILERIGNQLGYVFFDAFSGTTEYVPRNCITEKDQNPGA